MATIAVGTAGAIIGGIYGGPKGAFVGWRIGSTIGGLVDQKWFAPETKDSEQPQIDDLSVTSSAAGLPRPIGYGVKRLAGNVIWATDKVKVAGHGYIPEDFYEADFAVAFAGCVSSAVLRIWANDTLIYDTNMYGVNRRISNSGRRRSNRILWGTNFSFSFYNGAETQTADALMQADVGADRCPAHRGTTYILIENFPCGVESFFPHIEAEIAFGDSAKDFDHEVETDLDPSGCPFNAAEYSGAKLAIDWTKRYAYLPVVEPAGDLDKTGFRVIDLNLPETNDPAEEVFDETMDATCNDMGTPRIHDDAAMCVLKDGAILFVADDHASCRIVKVDGDTLSKDLVFGETSASSYGWDTSGGDWFVDPLDFMVSAETGLSYVNQNRHHYMIGATTGEDSSGIVVGVLNADTMTHVWSNIHNSFTVLGDRLLGLCRGPREPTQTTAYFVTGPDYSGGGAVSGSLRFYKLTINPIGDVAVCELLGTRTPAQLAPAIPAFGFDAAVTLGHAGRALMYDESDDTLIFTMWCDSREQEVVKYDPATNTLVWCSLIDGLASMPPSERSCPGQVTLRTPSDSTYSFIGSESGDTDTIVTVDTADGRLCRILSYGTAAIVDSVFLYDSTRKMLYAAGDTGEGLVAWLVDRDTEDPPTLDNVVEDLCGLVSLEASDVDVTDLATTTLDGYVISRHTSLRAILEDLAGFFLFDGVESDHKIVFKMKSDTSMLSITESDLVATTEGVSLHESRVRETELPAIVSLRYIDKDLDYAPDVQVKRRVRLPDRTMRSDNRLDIDVAIVSTGDVVKQQVEKILNSAWIERDGYDFGLSSKHLALDPGDVLTLTMDSGLQYLIRLAESNLGASLELENSGVSQGVAQYVSTETAGSNEGVPGQGIGDYPGLKVFVLDMPLLDDDQEPQDRVTGNLLFFIGRTRKDDLDFVNATVWQKFELLGEDVWRRIGTTEDECRWGIIPASNYAYYPRHDEQTPNFCGGSACGFTYLPVIGLPNDDIPVGDRPEQTFTNLNRMIVVFDDGGTEIIHYQESNELSQQILGQGPHYLVWDLLRGMRGTETMQAEYADGRLQGGTLVDARLHVIVLDQETKPIILRYPITSIGENLVFRVTAFNQPVADADDIVVTPEGRSLMPYAPAAINGERCDNDDVWVEWQRRTRVEGQMVDERPDVPLYEDFEQYEVEIYSPESSLVRTIRAENIGGTKVIYTAAQQTTDGVSLTAVSIWVKVYQLSAQVGRGFSRKREIQLNANPAKGAY